MTHYKFFFGICILASLQVFFYYINTNENTTWAFARKNDIFTCEITCYFHMWKDHHCYGYKINLTFRSKKNDFEFQCLYNKYNITWLLGDTKFPFECWKIFHKWAHFQHLKRNFISPRGQVINYPLQLYICHTIIILNEKVHDESGKHLHTCRMLRWDCLFIYLIKFQICNNNDN